MPSLVRLFVDDVLRKTALVNLTGTNGETFLTVYFKEESSPKVELRAVFLVGLDPNNIKVRQELNINTSTAVCFDNPMFPRAQPSIEMYAATVVPATSSSGAGSLEAPGGAMSQFNPSAALPGAVAAGAKLCVFQFGIKIYDCRLDHFCGSSALYHDVLRRSEQSNTFWSQKFSSEVYETRCPPLEDPHLGLPSENALIICVTPTIEIHSSVLLHLDTCGLQASAPLTGQAGAADGPDKFMQYILFRRSPFLLDDVSRYVKRYDKSIERKEMLDKNCIFMMIFKPSANASPPAGHSMGASMLAAPPSVVNVPPPQSLQANPALVGQPPLHQHQHQHQQQQQQQQHQHQHQHQQHQHQVPVSQAPYAPGPAGPYGAQVMAPMGPMGYPQGGGYPGHHQPPPGPGPPQHYMPEQSQSIYDPTAATPYGGGPAYPYPHGSVGGPGPGPPHPYAHMHPQHGSQAQGPPHAANSNNSGSNHGSGGPKQWTIPEGLAKLSELIRIEGGKLHSKVIGRAFRNYHLEAAEFIEAAVRNCVPASLTSLLSKHPECGIKRDTIDKMFNLVVDMDSNIGRVQMGSQHNSGGGDRNGGRDGRGGGSSGADRGNGGGFNIQTMMMQSSAYGQPPMPYGPGGNMVPMVPGGGIYGPVTNPIVPSHYTVGGPRAPPPPPSSSVPSSDGMSRYGPLGGAAAPPGRERGRDRGSRSRSRSRERGRDRGRDRDRSRSRSRERGRRGRDRRGRSVSSSPSPGAPPRDRERRGERGAYAAERRARGQEIKERKLEARRGQVCPQFKDGFCLWGRRCNMAHPSEMQRTDVVRPSGKQLDEAVNTLSRYLYHVGAPEGNHRAMVYEKVYEMFRRAHPEHHKTLDDLVLIDPDVENIGSAIVSKEVSRHLLSFRRGRQEDGELGATRSVLLVENAIVNVAL